MRYFRIKSVALGFGYMLLTGCGYVNQLSGGALLEKSNVAGELSRGNQAVLKAWLGQGHTFNELLENGETPLTASINAYHMVEYLLKQGADPNFANAQGKRPLVLSAKSNFNVTHLLLENKADPNLSQSDGLTPLQAALQNQHYNNIVLLFQKGARPEVNLNSGTFLWYHPGLVKLLLANGWDIQSQDAEGNSLLHLAQESELLELLLQKGLSPQVLNKAGESVLFSTSLEKIKFFKGLSSQISLQNTKQETPFHRAAETGRLDLLIYWLSQNKELLNKVDQRGQSPLHLAVSAKHLQVVQLLLEQGADPNMRDQDQDTPLLLSIRAKDQAIAESLLIKGADAKIRDATGLSTIALAQQFQLQGLIPLLKQHGATE